MYLHNFQITDAFFYENGEVRIEVQELVSLNLKQSHPRHIRHFPKSLNLYSFQDSKINHSDLFTQIFQQVFEAENLL